MTTSAASSPLRNARNTPEENTGSRKQKHADQNKSICGAVAQAIRVFASNSVGAELLAFRKMPFDPDVIADLAVKDLGQVPGVLVEIVFFGDDTDANHITCQRDIPEPSLFRNVGDRRGSLVDSRITEGAFGSTSRLQSCSSKGHGPSIHCDSGRKRRVPLHPP